MAEALQLAEASAVSNPRPILTSSSPHPHLIITNHHLIITSSSQTSPHSHLILTILPQDGQGKIDLARAFTVQDPQGGGGTQRAPLLAHVSSQAQSAACIDHPALDWSFLTD